MLSERPVRIRISHLLIRARTPSSPRVFPCVLFLWSNTTSLAQLQLLCPGLLVLCKGLEWDSTVRPGLGVRGKDLGEHPDLFEIWILGLLPRVGWKTVCSRSEASLGVCCLHNFHVEKPLLGWVDPGRAWGSTNRPVDEVPQCLKGVNSKWYGSPSYSVTKLCPGAGSE